PDPGRDGGGDRHVGRRALQPGLRDLRPAAVPPRLARAVRFAVAGYRWGARPAGAVLPAAGQASSVASTSSAARSPERMAPSTHPHMTAEVSVPAQWMRPHGARNV